MIYMMRYMLHRTYTCTCIHVYNYNYTMYNGTDKTHYILHKVCQLDNNLIIEIAITDNIITYKYFNKL